MARLSIVIPAAASLQAFEETLLSVLENRPPHCEVIVAHDASFIDPYDLADEVRFVQVAESNVLQLVNAGINASGSPLLHVVLPGCQVEDGWCEAPLELFAADWNLAAVSPRLRHGKKRAPLLGVNYRLWGGRRNVTREGSPVISPFLNAGFYRTSALRLLQGFDSNLGHLAEVDLGLRLACAGFRSVSCRASCVELTNLAKPTLKRGYEGGRQRAQLWHLARRAKQVTGGRWTAWLAELPLHRFGPRSLPALVGFLTTRSGRVQLSSVDSIDGSRHPRKAA